MTQDNAVPTDLELTAAIEMLRAITDHEHFAITEVANQFLPCFCGNSQSLEQTCKLFRNRSIPSRHPAEISGSDEMVRQDRLREQINSEVSGLMTQLLIDLNPAMVIVLPADRIISKQETPPHCAVHHMHNRNFIRRKDLNPSQPSHNSPQKRLQI